MNASFILDDIQHSMSSSIEKKPYSLTAEIRLNFYSYINSSVSKWTQMAFLKG